MLRFFLYVDFKFRFDSIFAEKDLRLAAICDPRFKLSWLPEDPSVIKEAKKLLADAIRNETQVESSEVEMNQYCF